MVVQDAAFFENVGPGEISMRATKDIEKIRTAFGEKLGYLIWSLSTVVTVSCGNEAFESDGKTDFSQALISSFINSPKLAGVLFSIVPFGILFFAILDRQNHALGGLADSLEGQASSFIEQLFSSVRLVQSFNMGPGLITQLDKNLYKRLQKLSAKRSIIRSLEQAFIYFAMFLVYSLAFWYGGIQVRAGLATGHVVTVSRMFCSLKNGADCSTGVFQLRQSTLVTGCDSPALDGDSRCHSLAARDPTSD